MAGYEKEYHRKAHSFLLDDEEYYLLRAKLALKNYFSGIPSSAKVLEFGAGMGQNIFLLKDRQAYDISAFSRKECEKRGIPVIKHGGEIPNGHFDVVFSSHNLEHLEDPLDNLKLLRKKLKKNGKLVLILPKEHHKKVDFKLDHNQHLYAWNFRTINNLLDRAGFKVIENRTIYGTAYHKLKFLSRISFALYAIAARAAGFLLGSSEMKITAIRGSR